MWYLVDDVAMNFLCLCSCLQPACFGLLGPEPPGLELVSYPPPPLLLLVWLVSGRSW